MIEQHTLDGTVHAVKRLKCPQCGRPITILWGQSVICPDCGLQITPVNAAYEEAVNL